MSRVDQGYTSYGMPGAVDTTARQLLWIGSSKKDLTALPIPIRKFLSHTLNFAQEGEQHEAAKVLKGFGGAGVLEVVEAMRTERTVRSIRSNSEKLSLSSIAFKRRARAVSQRQRKTWTSFTQGLRLPRL